MKIGFDFLRLTFTSVFPLICYRQGYKLPGRRILADPFNPSVPAHRGRRRRELITFFVLAFGIWPIVAVGVVGGYGFLVWMFQILYGPPGPPGH